MSGAATVIGSAHMDLIARAERLPGRGESVTGDQFTMAPGGKGGNQAVQLALCGIETTLIARVGDDAFGRELLLALDRKGVKTGQIAIDPVNPTGASAVLAAEADYASIIAPGAAEMLSLADLAFAEAILTSSDVVVLQWELPAAFIVEAIGFCEQRGLPVVFNASPVPTGMAALSCDAWNAVDWLVINRVEAGRLAGADIVHLDDAAIIAESLRAKLGVANVVITLGDEGSFWLGDGGRAFQAAMPALVADAVGAGDAYLGALVAGIVQGLSVRACLRRAAAAGAIAVSRPGAYEALPTSAEIDRFLT